jgi:hypothetical protein
MELDIKNADILVELLVAKRCAAYGAVVSVEAHRKPSPFALVEMLRRDLSEEVSYISRAPFSAILHRYG